MAGDEGTSGGTHAAQPGVQPARQGELTGHPSPRLLRRPRLHQLRLRRLKLPAVRLALLQQREPLLLQLLLAGAAGAAHRGCRAGHGGDGGRGILHQACSPPTHLHTYTYTYTYTHNRQPTYRTLIHTHTNRQPSPLSPCLHPQPPPTPAPLPTCAPGGLATSLGSSALPAPSPPPAACAAPPCAPPAPPPSLSAGRQEGQATQQHSAAVESAHGANRLPELHECRGMQGLQARARCRQPAALALACSSKEEQ